MKTVQAGKKTIEVSDENLFVIMDYLDWYSGTIDDEPDGAWMYMMDDHAQFVFKAMYGRRADEGELVALYLEWADKKQKVTDD